MYIASEVVSLPGWCVRDGDQINCLCFSRFGNLYGIGNELFGISKSDGSRGKVYEFIFTKQALTMLTYAGCNVGYGCTL